MKKILPIVVALLILGGLFFFLTKNNKSSLDQKVYEDTLSISKQYATLRYRSDNVLVKARDYKEYDDWNKEMSSIIEGWKTLESEVLELEKNADKLANEKTAFNLIKDVYAYNSVEIQKVIESAPMGKQVRTLAKHLGVDVKMAHLILNESQNRISQEIWTGEGNVYEGLEQDAMRIKNGAKVTVFVGGVVLTGGMAGVAASGVVAKTALVVGGADLVLEVADDEAKIALGDKNKVSEMVGKMRTVTEPAASILTLVNIPGNVSKAMEKISAVSFVGDQIRSVAQDEKVLGISIKVDDKDEVKTQVSGLTEAELVEWNKDNNVTTVQPIEEIMKQFEEEIKPADVKDSGETKEEAKKNINVGSKSDVTGTKWKGVLVNVSGGNQKTRSRDFELTLNKNGSAIVDSKDQDEEEEEDDGEVSSIGWSQEGSSIKIFGEDKDSGYYLFEQSGNTLVLVKIVIEGEDIMAGSEFMGGVAPVGTLYKQ